MVDQNRAPLVTANTGSTTATIHHCELMSASSNLLRLTPLSSLSSWESWQSHWHESCIQEEVMSFCFTVDLGSWASSSFIDLLSDPDYPLSNVSLLQEYLQVAYRDVFSCHRLSGDPCLACCSSPSRVLPLRFPWFEMYPVCWQLCQLSLPHLHIEICSQY